MLGDHCERSAIRRNDAVVCLINRSFFHPVRAKPFAHDWVVNELAENGEWRLLCQFFGVRDGIAHAETHSEMFSQNNFHL